MIGYQLQTLIDSGLVREQFVLQADYANLKAIRKFAELYADARKNGAVAEDKTIGALVIRHGILTPELIENTIIASAEHDSADNDSSNHTVISWAFTLGSTASPTFNKLVNDKALGTPVMMLILKNLTKRYEDYEPFKNEETVKKIASLFAPGASNIINCGILDMLEPEAALTAVLYAKPHRHAFVDESHNLLRTIRATEFLDEKRRQVAAVVAADDKRPLVAQLDAIWRHYTARSKLFREIDAEPPVADDVRTDNVTRVNKWQAHEVWRDGRDPSPPEPPPQRFIDIYGRYNCAEMDPLLLALIARTVGWYVDNRHAQLFTKVRLIPDRHGKFPKLSLKNAPGQDDVPWTALAFYPKMSLLRIKDSAFRDSLLGANRMFLTHSLAHDANRQKSIPIIGISTWKSTDKFAHHEPYALLGADFDRRDTYRRETRTWVGEDQASSIAGTIDETLRALREAEMLEIARADGIPLSEGADSRWTICKKKEVIKEPEKIKELTGDEPVPELIALMRKVAEIEMAYARMPGRLDQNYKSSRAPTILRPQFNGLRRLLNL